MERQGKEARDCCGTPLIAWIRTVGRESVLSSRRGESVAMQGHSHASSGECEQGRC